jgi:hypothetical protein
MMPEKNRLLPLVATKPVTASREAIPTPRSPLVKADADRPADVLPVVAEEAETIASATTAKSLPCDVPKDNVEEARLVEVNPYCA